MSSSESKLVATATARAALRGIVLVQTADDRGRPEWIAYWDAFVKVLRSLAEINTWLDEVEGRP